MVNWLNNFKIDIVFKQTTSNILRCRKCGSSVEGENGYMKMNINFYKWGKIDIRIIICMDCWNGFLKEIGLKKRKKIKSYEDLTN